MYAEVLQQNTSRIEDKEQNVRGQAAVRPRTAHGLPREAIIHLIIVYTI